MGWKDWPYWLKGGLIGVVVSIIYFIAGFFIFNGINLVPFFGFFSILARPLFYSWAGENGLGIYALLSIVSILIMAFITGSIIGLVVGKIKSK